MLRFKTRSMVFFDRSIIKRNWSNINQGPLHKIGALARTVERGLIRKDTSKKKTPSKPGRPPKSRAPGHPFKRIYYVVNRFQTNVIIGHVGFGAAQTPMEIHEEGQRVRIKRRIFKKSQRPIQDPLRRKRIRELFLQGRIRPGPHLTTSESIKMPERKFARPTVEKVAPRMPKLWENSVSTATVRN